MPRSTWISDLHWVRTGQQSRSQKTQESILDAAEDLFLNSGIETTSVADIAASAGCSVGAVYHHFRDKRSLLYTLLERFTQQTRATTRQGVDPARWEGAKVADILRGYIEFTVESAEESARIKHLEAEASRNDPALSMHLDELYEELNAGLRKLLLARQSEMGHHDPDTAVTFVLDQLATLLTARVKQTLAPEKHAIKSDQAFIDETLRMVCLYLQVETPSDMML